MYLVCNRHFNCGFRKQRTCNDKMMRLADDVHKSINNKQFMLAVMIDLQRAFDRVWHDGLLYTIKKLGLEGNIFNFIWDFLRNRTIQVCVGSELSSVRTLENGTPQGSVISPLLFLLMVNDITESDNGVKLSLYADDSAVWQSGKDIALLNRHLQHYLNVISRFYSEWGLKISTTKHYQYYLLVIRDATHR